MLLLVTLLYSAYKGHPFTLSLTGRSAGPEICLLSTRVLPDRRPYILV